jgi:hypothetical protein
VAGDPVLVSNVGAEAAPNSWTLPAGLSFTPTTVTALFNGAAAAGDFLAVLSFYSQSGQLMSRTFPPETVGAGDSVEVSFGPFLDRGSLGGGSAPGPWITPTLLNGWTDSTPSPGTFQYRWARSSALDAIEFKGWVDDGPSGSVVFTFPAEDRLQNDCTQYRAARIGGTDQLYRVSYDAATGDVYAVQVVL